MYGFPMAISDVAVWRALGTTATRRRMTVAAACFVAAFVILLVHAFAPVAALQLAALGLTGAGFAATWTAVLRWRLPVFSRRALGWLTLIWAAGLGLAIVLVLWAPTSGNAWGRRIAVQWLAFTLSLSLGSLQFRALFHRRATPILGRVLSLISPLVVLSLILFTTFRG